MNADASEASLRQRFGADAVRADSILIGEGQFLPGTVLFPDEPTRRLEILWDDTIARAHPSRISVRTDSSEWRVFPGIGIGSSLHLVDSLNVHPMTLLGLGTDNEGLVLSYNGGRLDTLWQGNTATGKRVMLQFTAPPHSSQALINQVSGETEYQSDNPAMRALNPRIYELQVRPRARK